MKAELDHKLVYIHYITPNIANICMNDVSGKNGLTHGFITDFVSCLNEAKSNEDIKTVVLSGLPDVFCSGADIGTLRKLCKNEMKAVDIVLSRMILHLPVPVISAMEGHAIGGGLAVGLCADIAIIAEESRYGCSFMNMGFTPGMGITKLMENFISPSLAQEMQYTGIFYKGKEFIGKSSFNYILPKSEVKDKALILAEAIAEKPRKSLLVLKNYQSMQRRKTFEETLTIESMMHEITLAQKETMEIIEENYVKY